MDEMMLSESMWISDFWANILASELFNFKSMEILICSDVRIISSIWREYHMRLQLQRNTLK